MYQIFIFIFLLVFQGCSVKRAQQSNAQMIDMLDAKSWHCDIISTTKFDLNYCMPNDITPSKIFNIFIEGDGFSWVTRSQPSLNPTPKQHVALNIALNQSKNNTIYVSRPCQNVFDKNFRNCNVDYWTNKILSNDVIFSLNEFLDFTKKRYQIQKFNLIGYSGGGIGALLLAAQRDDVELVVTIASNIDADAWTTYHKILKLDVINPATLSKKLSKIKQIHYVGQKDQNVPLSISQSYLSKVKETHNIKVISIENNTHSCCWDTLLINEL